MCTDTPVPRQRTEVVLTVLKDVRESIGVVMGTFHLGRRYTETAGR